MYSRGGGRTEELGQAISFFNHSPFWMFLVIALTTRIQQIQTHLRLHKKDRHSKRGLDALYVRRRKLLDYMERKEFTSYRKIVKTLGLVH